ncbi:MAG: translation initiation factor IF-3, partial [Opitutaceae bacterium]
MALSSPSAPGGRPGSYQRRNVDPFAAIRRNHRIKVLQVRQISPEGKQLGIIDTAKAINLALENGLDLVEVAPNATPPVCRIMDFGKYVYEE